MSATFTYSLFIIGLLILLGISFFIYYKNKSIKKVQINPAIAILASLFFIALWLFDLTSLWMAEDGWKIGAGVIPGETTDVPMLFIWTILGLAMIIITGMYFFYNDKFNKKTKEFHKWLIITMMIGVSGFITTAILMIFNGLTFAIGGFFMEGIYHLMLPLIIIPNIILLIDTR